METAIKGISPRLGIIRKIILKTANIVAPFYKFRVGSQLEHYEQF